MKKLVLLLICLCLAGCTADDKGSASVETSSATAETTVTSELTETATVSETTVAETTTVETTEVSTSSTTVTTSETAEPATVAKTTIETTATVAETTSVPETTVATTTTKAETTTTTTTVTTTAVETTTAAETTAETAAVDGHDIIEIEGKRYALTFEDEFEGTELDLTKWSRCPEQKRQDQNNYWDDDMSYLDGSGNLILEMSYEEAEDKYLSGAVRTKDKFEQAYGYFEVRCTANTVPGYWVAYWLMGETVLGKYNGGVDGTEIDVMETAYYYTKEVQNTLNWDGYDAIYHKYEGKKTVADVYDGEYHTFSVLWTEGEYFFYIDGEISWRTNAEAAEGTCEAPLYMKVTTETSSWTSAVRDNANFPAYIKVDYVRAYAAE